MIDIHLNYIAHFKQLGMPLLEEQGYKLYFEGIRTKYDEFTEICFFKNEFFYFITFSTQHLDYADGVEIFKSKKRDSYKGERVLPSISNGKLLDFYVYHGPHLDTDILRLINDFLNIEKIIK